jgi:CubicO group peptidase (beta-lactamase class C family)
METIVKRGGLAVAAVLAVFAATEAVAGTTVEGNFRIEYPGHSIGHHKALDNAVKSWMAANNIHAAQLAVRNQGVLIVSHAYTFGAANTLVTTRNVFRLASVSKALATAALTNLMTAGVLTGSEQVYPFLGVKTPLLPSQTPDPNSNAITVLELEEHTSGLPGGTDPDPLFQMRDVEVQLGTEPLTAFQFARYLYGLPLDNPPPTAQPNYSNVGYFLLGQVIAKAAGMPYVSYVRQSVLAPLGMTNWSAAPTSQTNITANQIAPEDPGNMGPSVFDISPAAPLEPFNFEGGNTIWEVDAAPADMMTNAESVSLLVHHYNAYGLGGRQFDLARDGCLPGVATWAESLNADIDFAVLFSANPCLGFSSAVIDQLRTALAPL